MQVPEKLTLIGGSILLASTLIFTLKSQASSILPKIAHPLDDINGNTTDVGAQYGSPFDRQWYQNKRQGHQSGTWGTAKYYIDDQHNMYVSSGQLSGLLKDAVGKQNVGKINELTFQGNVQAPQDSSDLFREMANVKHIYNTNDINVDHVDNTSWMFHEDFNLQSLDLSSWHLKDMPSYNASISSMFAEDMSLKDLNISGLDTTSGWNDGKFLLHSSLHQITLGDKTSLVHSGIDGTWKNTTTGQVLNSNQMNDGNSGGGTLNSNHPHPGTWVKQ